MRKTSLSSLINKKTLKYTQAINKDIQISMYKKNSAATNTKDGKSMLCAIIHRFACQISLIIAGGSNDVETRRVQLGPI